MGTYDWMELQTLTTDIAAARSRLSAARRTRDVGRIRALEEEISGAEARRERLLAHITTNLVSAPEAPRAGVAEPPAATGEAEPPPAAAEAAPPSAAAEAAPVDPVPEPAAEPPPEPAVAEEAPAEPEPAPEPEPTPELVAESSDPPPAAVVAEEPPPEPAKAEPPARAAPEPAVAVTAAPRGAARRAATVEGVTNVWDQLKPGDIDRVKRDLDTKRAEMLARHAEELKSLEADHAQLDTLEQAIALFMQKFAAPAGAGVVRLETEREARQLGAG